MFAVYIPMVFFCMKMMSNAHSYFVFCFPITGTVRFVFLQYIHKVTYYLQNDQYHPVWGQMENYAAGREKRKQLLLMLCQHEADRLEVWSQPTNTK